MITIWYIQISSCEQTRRQCESQTKTRYTKKKAHPILLCKKASEASHIRESTTEGKRKQFERKEEEASEEKHFLIAAQSTGRHVQCIATLKVAGGHVKRITTSKAA
jgi:hypothetical protein